MRGYCKAEITQIFKSRLQLIEIVAVLTDSDCPQHTQFGECVIPNLQCGHFLFFRGGGGGSAIVPESRFTVAAMLDLRNLWELGKGGGEG